MTRFTPPPPPPGYAQQPQYVAASQQPQYVMPPPPPPPPIPMPTGYARPPMGARRPGPHAPRPGMRAPMRPPVYGRNGEILTRNNRTNERQDQFEVPADMKKPGWAYQWVTASCLNKETPANYNAHYENGWRPVPSTDKPGWFHPVEYTGAIVREGLMLMERPEELNNQAIEDGIRAAQIQKHNQAADFAGVEKMLDQTGGHAANYAAPDRDHDARGIAAPRLKREIQGAPTALYPSRSLAIGDED